MSTDLNTQLDEVIDLCKEAVRGDRHWMAVIALHEVFRRLYPVDPHYRDRPNRTSVQEVSDVLSIQADWLRSSAGAIQPYALQSMLDALPSDAAELEERTHRLYGGLWNRFDPDHILSEAKRLLDERMLTNGIQLSDLEGKTALDIGCGSGRFTIGLQQYGCDATGVDMGEDGIGFARKAVDRLALKDIKFQQQNVLDLSFEQGAFDFILCNGVLHHTRDWKRGVSELRRVLKPGGRAFLYLYATGGIFWTARKRMREVFAMIPRAYATRVMELIGLPKNRFIFMDSWYVPIEDHLGRDELEQQLTSVGFSSFKKTEQGGSEFDLDRALREFGDDGPMLFGEGEHRYVLEG
ncbi:MAG: methyltransferase domain-containing protein [Myxococcota bacterium]|nr:methyltransferase domain-containing protein [Myxococcota bacterium]